LALWVTIKPKRERPDEISGAAAPEKALAGLLNSRIDEPVFDPAFLVLTPREMVSAPLVLDFDPPMGTEHAGLTYNAQPFLTTRHLGDDINGIGGKDSDLGDPVYSVADGVALYTGWPSDGWGNVIILLHLLPGDRLVESFYAHLDKIEIHVGQRVRRGQRIGKVGNAGGRYPAHLHFELRAAPSLDCGAGYADSALDRISGEASLIQWRGREDNALHPAPFGETIDPDPVAVQLKP